MDEMPLSAAVRLQPPQEIIFESSKPNGPERTIATIKRGANLNVSNLSKTQNMAYKIKTNMPKNYLVKPNAGILEVQSGVQVEIVLLYYSPNVSIK